NAGASAPASSWVPRFASGSERVANAQVGATRLDPVDGLAEVVHAIAGDQILLLRGRLLVEDVEDVEEELELADRKLARVLGADVQRVVRRTVLATHGARQDPAVVHAAVLVHVAHFRQVAA